MHIHNTFGHKDNNIFLNIVIFSKKSPYLRKKMDKKAFFSLFYTLHILYLSKCSISCCFKMQNMLLPSGV